MSYVDDMLDGYVDDMLDGYVECALWSSVHFASEDDPGTPMDRLKDASDFAPETLAEMRADCEAFLADNANDLAAMSPGQAGHDFWFTRNHYGCGFWDRGLGAIGDRLTDAAQVYGESDLYIGDDGKVYVS